MANYTSDLAQLETDRSNDLSALDNQYSNAIKETEAVYDKAAEQYVIDENDGKTTAVEQLMETQTALTNQAIAEIEQEREQSEKDYIKEQAASYADWQKQSDAYGVNAEKMASNGLTRSGYSESSQVQMYSDYQARVTSARESQKRADLNFINAITTARVQNNAALAQIALDAYQRESEIIIQGLAAKNGLLSEWTSQKIALNTMYDNKYQTILDQIYREEQLELQRQQMAQEQAQWSAEMAQNQAQFEASLAADQAKLDWQAQQNQLDRDDDNNDDKYNRLAELIEKHGHEATDQELADAGMTRAQANSYLRTYNENKKTAGGGGGGDDDVVYKFSDDDGGGVVVDDSVRIAGLGAGDTSGNNNSNNGGGLEAYLDANTPRPKTYKEACTQLSNFGVDSSSLMSEIEWARHKNSGNASSKAVTQNATYQDYLYDYMRGALTAIWPNTPNYTDAPSKKTTTNGAGGSTTRSTWEKHNAIM